MDARPAVRERVEGGGGGELAAADREAQSVAGHRIDEAGGVAGEQQTVDRRGRDVDRERPEHDRRGDEARAGRAVAKQPVARQLARKERGRVRERRVSRS